MSFFSRFRKRNTEDVYEDIAQGIVAASLLYSTKIEAPNNRASADAGAEVAYFFLHTVDRCAFQILGSIERDKVVDEVAGRVIRQYCHVTLKQNAPANVFESIRKNMLRILNDRQRIYAKCKSLGEHPGKGTMLFALSFYIHRALGNTDRDDLDDVLTGQRDIETDDLDDIPEPEQQFRVAVFVGSILPDLKIDEALKELR